MYHSILILEHFSHKHDADANPLLSLRLLHSFYRYYMNPQNGYNGNQQMMYAMQQAQASMAAAGMSGGPGTPIFTPLLVLQLIEVMDKVSMVRWELLQTVPRLALRPVLSKQAEEMKASTVRVTISLTMLWLLEVSRYE
jgi:hypothetical protein